MTAAILFMSAACIAVQATQGKQGEPPRYGEIIPLTKEQVAEAEQRFIAALQKEWVPRLTKICEVEGIDAMVFTLASPEYFPAWEKRHGVAGMRLLASSTDTFWEQIDGVQVFSVVGERNSEFSATFLDALNSLSPSDIEQIANGEGTLDMFGSKMDAVVERVALDPAMADVLLARGSSTSVAVRFYPHVRYRDPATGKVKTMGIPSQGDSDPFFTPEREGQPLYPYLPLEKPAGHGELDLGEGKVMTLLAFNQEAEKAFGAQYYIDGRLAQTPLFVRGRLDQATFEKVYLKVGAATPPVRKPDREKVRRDQLSELLRQHPELLEGWEGPGSIKAEDALNGRTLVASDLVAADPSLAMRLDAYGIPRDAIVEMEPGLLFIFDPGGSRDVMPPQVTPEGKSYRRTMSNRMQFVVIGS
ncbi:MAG: hypothetical protein AB1725_07300 [Armatimonadota bacterium]